MISGEKNMSAASAEESRAANRALRLRAGARGRNHSGGAQAVTCASTKNAAVSVTCVAAGGGCERCAAPVTGA